VKRASPLVQMTLALVGLCGTLVLLADLFLGVLPDRDAQVMQLRKTLSEAVAVQVAALLQNEDHKTLQRTLDGVAARTHGVRSLAIRRSDGHVLVQTGDHLRHWRSSSDDSSIPEQVTVPLNAAGARWGSFELAFTHDAGHPVWRFLSQPLVLTLFFISAAGTLIFGLYMRRTLQHLDPAAVIPERVQGAFDAMSEGVAVLDARGRLLLANKAFRALHADAASVGTGNALSTLPWLAPSLPADPGKHPWVHAMSSRAATNGDTLELANGSADARQLVINCAPITDPAGHVRGCLVTFDDVSQLHRANLALHDAMMELTASKEELQRQNVELERLATRDPLTGCLNRRAFHEAFEPMVARSRAQGTALTCVMVDIDHFKSVNDKHGHAVGDLVIRSVAKMLIETTRPGDLVCRYGGEEFCIALPGLGRADARVFAERLRSRIEFECGPGLRDVKDLRVTASLGVDFLTREVPSGPALLERADQALYRAKRSGRNRVCEFIATSGESSAEPSIDPVTGLMLRESFDRAFEAMLRKAQATGAVLSAVKLAVDEPSTAGAERDPAAADAALRVVADVLRESARPGDLLARLDRDHLGVIAFDLPIKDVLLFAERVRSHVEIANADPRSVKAGAVAPTVSAGVDSLPASASAAATLIERAAKALLRAKREGGNRVLRFAAPAPAADSTDAEVSAQTEALAP